MRYLLLPLVALISCSSPITQPAPPEEAPDRPEPGTAQAPAKPGALDTTTIPASLYGIYRTTGSGPKQTLALYPGRSFRLEEHPGSGQDTQRTKGMWTFSNQHIYLYKAGAPAGAYAVTDNALLLKRGSVAAHLSKVPAPSDNKAWKEKGEEGLEFFGTGTEPFWSIEIDEEQFLRFRLADWERPVQFPAAARRTSPDSLYYTVRNDSATLQVTIYPRFCSDGMSDFVYEQEVKVVYGGRIFKGCGLLYR